MRTLLRLLGLATGLVAAAGLWLRQPAHARRSTAAQGALERAVAHVDRELAADLELMAMFDQTKQPFVLENGQYLAVREVLEREAPAAFALVASVYERIPGVESSMERRGPAGSIPLADQVLIHEWEGDAREAQHALRASLAEEPPTRWALLYKRLRARLPAR